MTTHSRPKVSFKVARRLAKRKKCEAVRNGSLTRGADFDTKYPSTRAYFPSERLLATPKVRIRLAPPPSPYLSVFSAIEGLWLQLPTPMRFVILGLVDVLLLKWSFDDLRGPSRQWVIGIRCLIVGLFLVAVAVALCQL